MSSDRSKLIKMFEQEVWLFLSQELDEIRMKFWEEKISKSSELKTILNESKQILNIYDAETLVDIENPVFDKMVNKATKPSFIARFKNIFTANDNNLVNIPKIALATTLSIAAIIMLLLDDKPNQVKVISNEILEWDAVSLTEQMNEIETGISMVEQDSYKRYMILKLSDEKWNKNVYSISKDLEKLKKELKEVSM